MTNVQAHGCSANCGRLHLKEHDAVDVDRLRHFAWPITPESKATKVGADRRAEHLRRPRTPRLGALPVAWLPRLAMLTCSAEPLVSPGTRLLAKWDEGHKSAVGSDDGAC
jgi:hypothetical protein